FAGQRRAGRRRGDRRQGRRRRRSSAADDTREAMCGRMTQKRPRSEPAGFFNAEAAVAAPGGRFTLAPTDDAAVVVQREEHRAITAYRWGLIPHWSDSPKTGNRMFTPRSEDLDRNPAFPYAFSKRPCLVPADAYYEWKRAGAVGQPYAIVRPDGRPIAL